MCADDRRQNNQNNQATTATLRARSKKSDSDLVRENEEKFRFCPSEKNMDKLLDDLPPFTYNTIVKYVRNSGKNIQHSPDYMVMKPFERGVNFFIEGYLHKVGAQNHKESKTFYFRALCYRSLRKSEPPHKISNLNRATLLCTCFTACTCVTGSLGFCNHAVGLMYLVSHYSMTKAKMVHDDLHVNLKYNA